MVKKTFTVTVIGAIACMVLMLFPGNLFGHDYVYKSRSGKSETVGKQGKRLASQCCLTEVQTAFSQTEEESGQWETILYEDFSKMIDGSDTEPGTTMYPEDYFETNSWILPDKLFNTPGWGGIGVYEAGGNCALAYPRMGGLLMTPLMDLEGQVRITIRAKAINGEFYAMFPLCYGSHENPTQASEDFLSNNFKPEDEWQELKYEVVNPHFGKDSFFQINGMNYNSGSLVIDYIKIERNTTFIGMATGLKASEFMTDGFKASWNPAYGAEGYRLNLYRKTVKGTDNVTSVNNFTDISLDADNHLSGLAQGWSGTINPIEGEPSIVDSSDPYNGSNTLLLGNNSDMIEFNAGDSELLDLHIAIKKVRAGEYAYASLIIELFNDAKSARYTVPFDKLNEGWYEFTVTDDPYFTPGVFTGARISMTGIGDAMEWGISEVTEIAGIAALGVTTTPEAETVTERTDIQTTDTEFVFSGLDMNDTYSFTVSAYNQQSVSEATLPFMAYGVAAPENLSVSDIDKRGAYTARWEPATHASSYLVNSYQVHTAPENETNAVVFEENFSKSSASGLEFTFLDNSEYISLNQYTDNYGWEGSGTIIGNGMLGCYTGSYDLYSPTITLDNGDGEYTVDLEYFIPADEGESINDQLIVQGGEINYGSIRLDKAGEGKATVRLDQGENFERLMFYTLNGTQFAISKVKVTQNINAGDKVYLQLDQYTTDNTEYRISGLRPDDNLSFAFSVRSLYERYGSVYRSDISDICPVTFNSAKVDYLYSEPTAGEECIFTVDGIRVHDMNAKGMYIVRKNGKSHKVIAR